MAAAVAAVATIEDCGSATGAPADEPGDDEEQEKERNADIAFSIL